MFFNYYVKNIEIISNKKVGCITHINCPLVGNPLLVWEFYVSGITKTITAHSPLQLSFQLLKCFKYYARNDFRMRLKSKFRLILITGIWLYMSGYMYVHNCLHFQHKTSTETVPSLSLFVGASNSINTNRLRLLSNLVFQKLLIYTKI